MSAEGNRWVFGYGSLMWNPGFPHLRAVPATIDGYHRQLCVYSLHYRGAPERPGVVFGLDRGGSCRGVAFEVAAQDWPEAIDYLRKREQITMVYEEVECEVLLDTGSAARAVTYVVDKTHPQCACGLSPEETVNLIRQGVGVSGSCLDYVRNTHRHLGELGLRDERLDRIVEMLG